MEEGETNHFKKGLLSSNSGLLADATLSATQDLLPEARRDVIMQNFKV